MIKILFIKSNKAYLPEVNAYMDYFNNCSEFSAVCTEDSSACNLNNYDVIWEFKGFGGMSKRSNQVVVHEYTSLSTGKFPKIKNFLKAALNPKPDLRVFLNNEVKKGFNFCDNIDFCLRDMGVDERFITHKAVGKEYDFVYVGSICKERGIDKLLDLFIAGDLGSLCLVGSVTKDLYHKYNNYENITFIGRVDYEDVPKVISSAEYALNFIPDKYPFNIQTSTKLLEYLAMNLKVVSTNYEWIRQFESGYNCKFLKIDFNNLRIEKHKIDSFDFISHFDANIFLWKNIIYKSGIKEKLISLCHNLKPTEE